MPDKLIDFNKAQYQIVFLADFDLESDRERSEYTIEEMVNDKPQVRLRIPSRIAERAAGYTLTIHKDYKIAEEQTFDRQGSWCAAVVPRVRKGGAAEEAVLIPIQYVEDIVVLPIRWKEIDSTERDANVLNVLIR